MPRKRFKTEEIIQKLREAEVLLSQGRNVSEACRQIGVTDNTYYRWRDAIGDLILRGGTGDYHDYQIPPSGFTFGWKGFTGQGQTSAEGVSIAAGQTKTLMSYFFKEGRVVDGKEARTVTLLLKARMMLEATEKDSDRTE